MPRVVHFEINVDDPERAVKFYSNVFQWKIENWSGPVEYWLIRTGPDSEPGINGTITRRVAPGATTINSISVTSLDESLKMVVQNGGKQITPKTNIPGVGFFAYCQDTEDNQFGVIEPEPMQAKS